MPIHRLACLSLVLGGVALLAACAAPAPQEFAVTQRSEPAPVGTLFRTSDPNINDVLAKGYCADGYEKLDAKTAGRAFDIAGYRFDSIFRPLEQLLVPKAPPPAPHKAATAAAPGLTPTKKPVPAPKS